MSPGVARTYAIHRSVFFILVVTRVTKTLRCVGSRLFRDGAVALGSHGRCEERGDASSPGEVL